MTRLIHTGDTHLGYHQYHSEVRRQDFLDAFAAVIADAIDDDVDAVIHAGDLFHSRRPDLEDLVATIDLLSELRAADIPLYAVVGNHEGTHSAQWLDLFEALGLATRLGTEAVTVGDLALYGLDYLPEAQRDRAAYAFEPVDVPTAALVSHGAFAPFPYGTWDLEAVLEASPVAFDAVLLGDNHDPLRREVDGVPAVYCGSTERVSAEEREARGYNLVRVDDGLQISRRGIETRDFVFVDVDLGAGEGGERVRDRIREESIDDAVVIVTIEGDGERVVPADVEAFAEERGALVTRVNDRRAIETGEPVDVSFADPDAAVRDRIRDLGVSEVAHSIDETVRTGSVPDSTVGEVVEERVREVMEDPTVFEPPSGDPSTDPDEDESPGEDEEAGDDGDGQVTMEDYL